jgi:uncharacterized membrane protein
MNMAYETTNTDRIRSFLVLAATIGVLAFNWLAASGRLAGVDTSEVSDRYSTLVTPAGYAFSIWSLIYLGLVAFSIYQLLPANIGRFRAFRSLYIFTCALNCGWLYFWHADQIVICFVIIVALCLTLLAINYLIREPESLADSWIAKAPFSLYFGWVTAATFVNFAIMLKYLRVEMSPGAETGLAVALILLLGVIAVIVRLRLTNYFYPLAVAWALTAIAVKQSGRTAIVVACAAGVVACLIATLSFVVNLPSKDTPRA